jgi:hypothetical protein
MVTHPIFYLSTDYPRESILVGVVQHATTGLWYTGERRTKRPSMMEHLVTTNIRDINKDFYNTFCTVYLYGGRYAGLFLCA